MELQEFIDALYDAGWNAPNDAQHANIVNVYNDVRICAARVAYDLGIKAGLRQAEDINTAMQTNSEVLAVCRAMHARGDFVAAVKHLRAVTGCGLKEAVEAIRDNGVLR